MVDFKDLQKREGHRKRLRARFLQSGFDGFLDYEIVELLLTLGTPRKDCKQVAKETIKTFGGLRGVLDASFDELRQVKGIGPSNAFGIKLFQVVSERYAKEKISQKIPLVSPKAVADYLREKLGREKKEHFVILSLDVRNNLIKVSDISIGTLNANLVHPREVFKEAIRRRYFQPSFILDRAILDSSGYSGQIRKHDGFLVRDFGLFGMSGGPVFNIHGIVVGIQASITQPRVSKGSGERSIIVENAVAIRSNLVLDFLKKNNININFWGKF